MLTVLTQSRAGSLLQGFKVNTNFVYTTLHCGSELARDGGVSDIKDVECMAAIAGKPAPTGFSIDLQVSGLQL
jgi:hypothetical protein